MSIISGFLGKASINIACRGKEFSVLSRIGEQASFPMQHVTESFDRSPKFPYGFVQIPERHGAIVERWGKFHRELSPGTYVLLPLIEKVAYCFPLYHVPISLEKLEGMTKDGITVVIQSDLLVRVTCPKKAAYEGKRPFALTTLHGQVAMRKSVSEISLEDLVQRQDALMQKMKMYMNDALFTYGLECTHYSIKQLCLPQAIQQACEERLIAEQKQKELVSMAEMKESIAIQEAKTQVYVTGLLGEAMRKNPQVIASHISSQVLSTLQTVMPTTMQSLMQGVAEEKETSHKTT